MSIPPLASIIIINYNGERFIEDCLESIIEKTKVLYEIIVVDNGSKDKSRELLKKYQSQKRFKLILLKTNLGPAKARNLATQESQGKYLMFLDYDTVVGKNWLRETVAYLEKNPKIGGGQLKLLRMDRKNVYDSAGEKLTPFGFLAERAQEAEDRGQFDKVENIFSGKGAAMIVRSNLFQKIGGFDEDYFMYWEEPDLIWHIWKAGFRFVFLPMDTVYHAYGSLTKPVSQAWTTQITYLGCRNQITTIIKNGVGFKGFLMLISVVSAWCGLFFLFLLKLNRQKAQAVLKAFFYLFSNFKLIWKKRVNLKKKLGKRYYSDENWLYKIKDNRKISWYFGKGLSYVLGKPF